MNNNIDIKQEISDCKTICLALGPYRNFTTLTAATLFLHPNCQVLNHAGDRIFENSEVNFLLDYTKKKFNNFIDYAIQISAGGTRGNFGGSITYAHAFDAKHNIKEIFQKTGQQLVKTTIHSLFWKESLKTSNYIKENKIDLGQIIEQENRIRFLMPIRNPMDCAKSNLKTGHVTIFKNLSANTSIEVVLQEVLNEIHWFAKYKEKFPNHFFYYLEHSMSRQMIQDLADFLKLEQNDEWISNAQSVMVSKSTYTHDEKLKKFYKESVEKQFSDLPQLQKKLLAFL